MARKFLMLSIRPQYAKKIFAGEKKVELRKVKPQVKKGDLILVYVSSPEKSLQGILVVERVIKEAPIKLWAKVKNDAGVTVSEFNEYFFNRDTGYGIYFSVNQTFLQPVSLDELRDLIINFHPPQNYRYFTQDEVLRYGDQLGYAFI